MAYQPRGQGLDLTKSHDSAVTCTASVKLRHLWDSMVASFANLETLVLAHLAECLGTKVHFKSIKQVSF